MKDTQIPPPSPLHSTDTLVEIIKIKGVVDTSSQKIDSLNAEDLTKILDQSIHQAQLCTSPILVSVEELQKSIEKLKEVKVPPQEPPKTTQTTRILILPPPSPPKLVTQALQELSVAAGVDIGILV